MGKFGRNEGKALRFDLTDMRLFLTVVEQGSLTKGADESSFRFRERAHVRNGNFAWRATSGAKQAGGHYDCGR